MICTRCLGRFVGWIMRQNLWIKVRVSDKMEIHISIRTGRGDFAGNNDLQIVPF